MFVIFQDRIATNCVAEELLPEGRSFAVSRARETSPKETRSDALVMDSLCCAMLKALTAEPDPSETLPSVPRIRYDASRPVPYRLEVTPPNSQAANPMARRILPTSTETSRSDRTQNARYESGIEQKSSTYHGKTIAKQCLPPPSRQSFRRGQSQ